MFRNILDVDVDGSDEVCAIFWLDLVLIA